MRGVDRVFKIKGSLCIITPIEYVLYCVVVLRGWEVFGAMQSIFA